ncbi:hypothetical protein FB472_2266 [Rhodoglobus vestalii]|uniref:Uncharacterized protein n=1 Tax=Rhodoglobus vestalii TaxID=193384 RepID=A0A8H2K9K4_9MICO|nr:hypothetical protein FB472_2266 [Rhodoglobus vestalii]
MPVIARSCIRRAGARRRELQLNAARAAVLSPASSATTECPARIRSRAVCWRPSVLTSPRQRTFPRRRRGLSSAHARRVAVTTFVVRQELPSYGTNGPGAAQTSTPISLCKVAEVQDWPKGRPVGLRQAKLLGSPVYRCAQPLDTCVADRNGPLSQRAARDLLTPVQNRANSAGRQNWPYFRPALTGPQ